MGVSVGNHETTQNKQPASSVQSVCQLTVTDKERWRDRWKYSKLWDGIWDPQTSLSDLYYGLYTQWLYIVCVDLYGYEAWVS